MSQTEYLEFRCCICPNRDNPMNNICPPKPSNPKTTECRFVKTYIDNRGWKYKVMAGLGDSNYKARYQKPGKSGWKCMRNLEWRNSFDEAQSDLNVLAKLKGWSEISFMETIKIRMLQNVRPELLFLAKPGTILRAGEEYPAQANGNGAIIGLCQNGEYMGVKPGEFEFVAAPQWVLDIWNK